MKTGAEIVLEWFRKYSEQNGTPTPFEIRCQLEMAIEHDKTELKNLRLGGVSSRRELLLAFLKSISVSHPKTNEFVVDNFLSEMESK